MFQLLICSTLFSEIRECAPDNFVAGLVEDADQRRYEVSAIKVQNYIYAGFKVLLINFQDSLTPA